MPDMVIPRIEATGDPILPLFDEFRRALERMNVETIAEEEPREAALDEAQARFAFAPTTSLIGLLLKLELIAEVEDYEGHLDENPQLLAARAILGMIDDLRRALGLPVHDRKLPRRLGYREYRRQRGW